MPYIDPVDHKFGDSPIIGKLNYYSSNGARFASVEQSLAAGYTGTIPTSSAFGRSGKNSTTYDIVRVYGQGALQLTKKWKVIGYTYRNDTTPLWYTDRRGRLRKRRVNKTVRVPIYLQVYKTRVLKPMSEVKDNRYYLKPTQFSMGHASEVITPPCVDITVKQYGATGMPDKLSYEGVVQVSKVGTYMHRPYDVPSSWDIPTGIPPFNAQFYPGIDPNSLPFVESNSLALSKLYKKVSSDIPDYLTAAAESRELFRTTKKILLAGLSLARDIKRLDVKRLQGRLDVKPTALYSAWLTWAYGIAPVLSDIQDTIDVVKRSDRYWRTFKASSKVDLPTFRQPSSRHTNGVFEESFTATTKWGVIISGQITVDSIMKDAVKAHRFWATTYELVPFSFMLDWAVDISGYLKSTGVFSDKEYSAWQTVVLEQTQRYTGTLGPDAYRSDLTYESTGFTQEAHSFVVSRNPIKTIPEMPDIKVKKPVFDMTAIDRAINAFSILVTSTNGLKRPFR